MRTLTLVLVLLAVAVVATMSIDVLHGLYGQVTDQFRNFQITGGTP